MQKTAYRLVSIDVKLMNNKRTKYQSLLVTLNVVDDV